MKDKYIAKSGKHPETNTDNVNWVEINGECIRMPQGGVETHYLLCTAEFAASCYQRALDSGKRTSDNYYSR